MSTIDRLLGVISVMLNKEAGEESSQEPVVFKSGINIIKDDSGYKWLGVYSNSFRDDDMTPEIISSKSHRNFVAGIDKGIYQLPDLYLWHVPEWKFGEATFVAYDEVEPGVVFAIAGGTIDVGKENVAEALLKSGEQWQMSHGMPTGSIKHSADDDTVYDKHISTEVSVLPGIYAANHLTGFGVLEDDMIPTKKRAEIMEKLSVTDGFLDNLEAANKQVATDEKEAREFKEVSEKDSVVVEVETVEIAEVEAEPVIEAVEAEEIDTEVVAETADSEVPSESIGIQSLMDELAGVKEVIVDLVGAVKMINDSQKETGDEIVALKKEREEEVVKQTPTFSQFYGNQIKSIIGQKEAAVVEDDEAMTGPEEKAANTVKKGYGSFVDNLYQGSKPQ